MNYLNTLPIHLGQDTFTISEFTALDRLRSLQYEADLPVMDRPGDDASREEKLAYSIFLEENGLKQVTYSLALSLMHQAHTVDGELRQFDSVEDLQAMLDSQWPIKKLNQAYELLNRLNDPNFEPEDDDQAPKEPPTPEKS
ncbi:hypothetical protein L7E35_004926 [Vibrio parahaemolyticus]|nr:hypothetical protein [Vibrio parahaemolyticus]EIV1599963.1 hypothetical protein [Vibrio parahaemolyticus]